MDVARDVAEAGSGAVQAISNVDRSAANFQAQKPGRTRDPNIIRDMIMFPFPASELFATSSPILAPGLGAQEPPATSRILLQGHVTALATSWILLQGHVTALTTSWILLQAT